MSSLFEIGCPRIDPEWPKEKWRKIDRDIAEGRDFLSDTKLQYKLITDYLCEIEPFVIQKMAEKKWRKICRDIAESDKNYIKI